MTTPMDHRNTRIVAPVLGTIVCTIALAISIPVLIGGHLRGEQQTAQIQACTRISNPKVAQDCVQTVLYGPQYNSTLVKP